MACWANRMCPLPDVQVLRAAEQLLLDVGAMCSGLVSANYTTDVVAGISELQPFVSEGVDAHDDEMCDEI